MRTPPEHKELLAMIEARRDFRGLIRETESAVGDVAKRGTKAEI